MKKVEDYVVSIPDFPEPGIIFRDVTSVLQDAEGLKLAIDGIQEKLKGLEFDVIAGTESRGFIFGMPVAYNLGKPFVLVRKKGKLPRKTVSIEYELEYGNAEIEMHKDSIKPGQKVVLIDDLIETGGASRRRSGEDGVPDGTCRPEGKRKAGKIRRGQRHLLRRKVAVRNQIRMDRDLYGNGDEHDDSERDPQG